MRRNLRASEAVRAVIRHRVLLVAVDSLRLSGRGLTERFEHYFWLELGVFGSYSVRIKIFLYSSLLV